MAFKFVVGLFESKGIAEDACNRLKHEGVAAGDISLLLMHDTAPLPETVKPEIGALSVDPMVVGDVRESYAPYIRNGETAIFVRARSEEEVEFAVGTIRQYVPMRVRIVAADSGIARGRDVL